VDVLRLDKIHSIISGNKWFKLQYYLQEASELKKKTIITFGGAWSNHIIATAAACEANNFGCIGVIRGEQPATFSTTLLQAKEMGMEFIFSTREEFKKKLLPPELLSKEVYIIPEGGYGLLGAKGAASILEQCDKHQYTHIACAAGTGTMMAGLITGSATQQIVGISVLKNNFSIEKNITSLLPTSFTNYSISHDYHFGGYAKFQPKLIHFMNELYQHTGIPSDFVYTGKLFYGIKDLIQKSFFPAGSKMLLIHSGGLQGNMSLKKGTLIF
jgi:1-aminocyclopropane-1-carboxylate deaminase